MATTSDPWAQFSDHEEVVISQDPSTGLRAVVAIHSTKLGPALGGTRMALYSEHPDPHAAAYSDALRLSRAMTLKNALAGLNHGGGKAVLISDPATKSRQELLNYGLLIESLGGKYVTAGDVGMQVADMDVVGETSQYVTGRSPENGGVGDSGILTALGIWQGMQAAVEFLNGSNDLSQSTVGVIGAGKVGGRLISHLIESGGAKVIAMDPISSIRAEIIDEYPEVEFVGTFEEMLAARPSIISPNAMGGFITSEMIPDLTAAGVSLVCGGANNQLAQARVGDLLAAAGILYAPDFMVNCGGVIQVAEELVGANVERAREQVMKVYQTTLEVLESAKIARITPVAAAEAKAWERINA
jgi:valine dehydrogenase (NAD+)